MLTFKVKSFKVVLKFLRMDFLLKVALFIYY